MSDNFEQLLSDYKKIAEKISSPETSMEESIDLYVKSQEIYKKLSTSIEEAQLKIENIRE